MVGGVVALPNVNRSRVVVAEVPYPKNTECPSASGFVVPDVTRTSTVPAAPAGAVTSMRVLRDARGWQRPSDHAQVMARFAL